jgi:hypothetical protein
LKSPSYSFIHLKVTSTSINESHSQSPLITGKELIGFWPSGGEMSRSILLHRLSNIDIDSLGPVLHVVVIWYLVYHVSSCFDAIYEQEALRKLGLLRVV